MSQSVHYSESLLYVVILTSTVAIETIVSSI